MRRVRTKSKHSKSRIPPVAALDLCPHYVSFDRRARSEQKERIAEHLNKRKQLIKVYLDACMAAADQLGLKYNDQVPEWEDDNSIVMNALYEAQILIDKWDGVQVRQCKQDVMIDTYQKFIKKAKNHQDQTSWKISGNFFFAPYIKKARQFLDAYCRCITEDRVDETMRREIISYLSLQFAYELLNGKIKFHRTKLKPLIRHRTLVKSTFVHMELEHLHSELTIRDMISNAKAERKKTLGKTHIIAQDFYNDLLCFTRNTLNAQKQKVYRLLSLPFSVNSDCIYPDLETKTKPKKKKYKFKNKKKKEESHSEEDSDSDDDDIIPQYNTRSTAAKKKKISNRKKKEFHKITVSNLPEIIMNQKRVKGKAERNALIQKSFIVDLPPHINFNFNQDANCSMPFSYSGCPDYDQTMNNNECVDCNRSCDATLSTISATTPTVTPQYQSTPYQLLSPPIQQISSIVPQQSMNQDKFQSLLHENIELRKQMDYYQSILAQKQGFAGQPAIPPLPLSVIPFTTTAVEATQYAIDGNNDCNMADVNNNNECVIPEWMKPNINDTMDYCDPQSSVGPQIDSLFSLPNETPAPIMRTTSNDSTITKQYFDGDFNMI